MKKGYCVFTAIISPINRTGRYIIKLLPLLFTPLLIVYATAPSYSQGVIPTKGKEFWIGFPYNPQFGNSLGTKRCDVFITSEFNTTGVISIPQQGYTQTFTVIANQTTTITLPFTQVEHTTSEIIENKGVEIVTLDTVSVFAISFQKYTADGTLVYPKQSLGTEYRICSYQGIVNSSPPNLNSDLLVVATEDGTQIEVTPSASTLGGKPVGIPFIVNLNAGQSYQIQSSSSVNDLTGTLIKGTAISGSCRPFAVFSGSACVRVPSGCTACDIIYDQALPVANWGQTYYAVPFSFASSYTIRILANQNNTVYTINGGAPVVLNAGQFTEVNNITGTMCITANEKICVVQYMQGITCSGAGDPSMMYLNSQDQKIDRVVFSTVTSNIITQHNVNVIMNTAHVGQLKLDGVTVPTGSFSTFSFCNNISYAQLSLNQGSHILAADSGFTAYIYGTGSAESYAYSVGSYSKNVPIIVDSILCSSDTIHMGTTTLLFGVWWATVSNPNDTIGTNPVLTLTPPITPDIYVQHGNEFISGCTKDFYFKVEVPDPPQLSLSLSSDTVCANQTVQLNALTIPTSPFYTYSWTPTIGLSNPNIANPIITATASRWYKVTIESPNGCMVTIYDSIFLFVEPLPQPNISNGGIPIYCLGDTATLSATGGITYSWMPGGSNNDSIIVSPAITTNYVVIVTDSNGCVNSDSFLLAVRPLPNANAGVDQSICIGATTTITATGGGTYLWMPGGNTTNSISISPINTSAYFVTVTSVYGCSKTDTVNIVVNSLPTINAGANQTICSGQPTTLTATGGVNYVWFPGVITGNTITVTPLVTTNYIVQATDSNGCHGIDTMAITVNPSISGSSRSQAICFGETLTLSDSGGVSFYWTPGGSTNNSITVSPLVTTNYIVQMITPIGCQIFDTIHIIVNSLPLANAGIDQTICTGFAVTLTGSGGTGYVWTNTGNTNSTITFYPTSTMNYIVEVTDNNGCKNSDTVKVVVNDLPKANAGPDQAICSGTSVSLTATGGLNYQWNPGGFAGNPFIVTLSYPVKYIVLVTDSNGCQNQDTISISINANPEADFIVPAPMCENTALKFTNTSTVIIVKSEWKFGDGTNSSAFDAIHAYQTANNYLVRLIVTNDKNCLDSTEHLITVNANPEVNFVTQNNCLGEVTTINNLSGITSGNNAQWFWDFGDGNTDAAQTPEHIYQEPGQYSIKLIVTSDSSCVSTLVITNAIEIYPLPEANFLAAPDMVTIFDPKVEFIDQSVGGNIWEWDFGDNQGRSDLRNPYYYYSDTGTFNARLILTNIFGCTDTNYKEVYVKPDFTIYIPNAFTPNGDFKNDYFIPLGIGISTFDLYIFDRWGHEIFHTNTSEHPWDGKTQNSNQDCDSGVYVYKIDAIDYRKMRHEYEGVVSLVR